MGQTDALGQLCICFDVTKLMRDVREPCVLRADAPRPPYGLLDGRVTRVRLVAQRRQDDIVQSFKQREAVVGNRAYIGQISIASETESADLQFADAKSGMWPPSRKTVKLKGRRSSRPKT